jgi:hypothetical protein
MIGARRVVLACLLGAAAAGIAPSPARAAGCEAILGKWIWFTGGVVSINADGTLVHDPGNDGTAVHGSDAGARDAPVAPGRLCQSAGPVGGR